MTTPSTTVLVDGTPDERSTSEATSVNGEDNPLTPSVMRRRHFELLAVPIAQEDHRYPSSFSFDASLDQLPADGNRDGLQSPTDQDATDVHHGSSTSIQNNSDHLSINHSSHHLSQERDQPDLAHSTSKLPSPPPATYQVTETSTRIAEPSTQSPQVQPTLRSPQQPGTNSNIPDPSIQSASPNSQHRTQLITRRQHRRRRILRWLRRRLDRPLPWSLDLRRRAENVRRRISDVDRVLP
ncbi:MAG: hypothetical protein Q9210_000513 [Variospora velana]